MSFIFRLATVISWKRLYHCYLSCEIGEALIKYLKNIVNILAVGSGCGDLSEWSHTSLKYGGGLVTKSCLTLCNPMDYILPGSSVHGILQARTLEWVAISFSRGSSQPRNQTRVSCIAGRFFTNWAMREYKSLN